MAALHRIERYLDKHMIPFDIVSHPHTHTSAETARASGIEPSRLAKGVLLEGVDCEMVAMIPADQEIQLAKLGKEHGVEFRLADESRVQALFADCEPGVVPGLPNAWGVEMIWEDGLLSQPDIYLEAGDHERLVHVETRYLHEMFDEAPHCRFTKARLR